MQQTCLCEYEVVAHETAATLEGWSWWPLKAIEQAVSMEVGYLQSEDSLSTSRIAFGDLKFMSKFPSLSLRASLPIVAKHWFFGCRHYMVN